MNERPVSERPVSERPVNERPLRVLVVDDSAVVRQLIRYILEQQGIAVIGEACDGENALTLLTRERPDVITMDIHMPGLDGYQTSRRIMEENPVPIVIVTASYQQDDAAMAMRVLEAGAVTVLQKPQGLMHPEFERDAQALVRTVRAVSEVKLVRRIRRPPASPETPSLVVSINPAIVVIGASTGGPVAIKALLQRLPAAFPWPVLIVQHIAPGFLPSFCTWLGECCALPVSIGVQGETALPGHVYLAPDHRHMEIDANGKIALVQGTGDENLCPSVARLFSSVARHYGERCIAILLSGMGRDGADEMLVLKGAGALTLAQDPATVVVNGMPGEAVRLGAVCHVLSPEGIGLLLNQLQRERADHRLPQTEQ